MSLVFGIVNFTTPALIPRVAFTANDRKEHHSLPISSECASRLRLHTKIISRTNVAARGSGGGGSVSELNGDVRKFLQDILCIDEAVYIIWLFLLVFSPGGHVWAISSDTINSLIRLSLNVFFVLSLTNSGIIFFSRILTSSMNMLLPLKSDSVFLSYSGLDINLLFIYPFNWSRSQN